MVETYTVCGCYTAVFRQYQIKKTNAVTAVGTPEVARQIYTVAQEGMTTAFLQWHQGAGGVGAHITLLHCMSSYVLWVGRLLSP